MSGSAVLTPQDSGFVRKQWTMEECRQLVTNGVLTPGSYELIQGDVVSKMGQGRLHIAIVTQIIVALAAVFGLDFIQSQAPIGIGARDPINDPEPDVAVLAQPIASYTKSEPDPRSDILLVVEASDTTLPGDTTTKALLYSTNEIQEYWVVSIVSRELIVYKTPTPGGYADAKTYREGSYVSPLCRPNELIAVSSLLV